MKVAGFVVAVVVCIIVGLSTVSGCGSSNSGGSSEQELEAAKREGEETAREKVRIGRLQQQVHHLQHEVHRQGHTVVESDSGAEAAESASVASSVLRTFHAPSGNVSCEILSGGALCSVESTNETFSFDNGEEARIESGAALSRGAGELAPYGSTVSASSITCSIPRSDEPRGITCSDGESGHGFEASRVPDRQSAY